MHSSTTAIEFVALVVRPRHVAALTEITQQAPIVAAFGKRARFVELGVCQYHQRFSDSTYSGGPIHGERTEPPYLRGGHSPIRAWDAARPSE